MENMNRHRAYWSAMGLEPNNETSALANRRTQHKEQLKKMINQYPKDGFNEVVKLLKEIHEEMEE